MKRWVIDRHGRGSLRVDQTSVRHPGAGEVLVRVSAVALNSRDLMMIETGMGLALEFPFVPGSDMAGVVEAVGPGVTRFAAGDHVISNFLPDWTEGKPGGTAQEPSYKSLGGYYPGVLADYVTFSEQWFTLAPATLDDVQASTLPVAGLTAWFSLIEQGGLKAGETVFLPGTGGVALFALQIAVAHGAEVIITSSSEEKLRRAAALGAAHGINRTSEDVVKKALALTGGRGANHVLRVSRRRKLQRLGRDRVGWRPYFSDWPSRRIRLEYAHDANSAQSADYPGDSHRASPRGRRLGPRR